MSDDSALPLQFTDAAAIKVKDLVSDEDNPNLRLRVYITGGGCSGFQYGFTFDDQTEGLEGSRFIVTNPNAKSTCGCGSSFSV